MAGKSTRKQWLVAVAVTLFNILLHVQMNYHVTKHLEKTVLKSREVIQDSRNLDLKRLEKDCSLNHNLQQDTEASSKEEPQPNLDTLPVCERPQNFNRVYLLETVKEYAIPKVLCTMESLARHMPNWCIVLYILNYDEEKNKDTKGQNEILKTYSNTRILKLDPHQAVMDTPFEGIFKTERFLKAGEKHLFYAHYSDILRVVLLYRYGGIYVDLDIIALRSLDLAPQYLVRTGHGGVANGMMKFRNTSFMLLRYVSNVWTDYEPGDYSRLFFVLCESVEDHCKHLKTPVKGIDMKPGQIEHCDGVTIFGYNSGAFAPFAVEMTTATLFNKTHANVFQKVLDDSKSAFIHYSGNAKGNYNVEVRVKTDDSLFARVFRQQCPLCSEMFDNA